MFRAVLCGLVPRGLSLPEWQEAIDRQRYAVSLLLDEAQPEAEAGGWRARLAGRPVTFTMTETVPTRLLLPTESPGAWARAFCTPGSGTLRDCAAGGIALLAYVAGAEGAFYDPEIGLVRDFTLLREGLEAMAIAASG